MRRRGLSLGKVERQQVADVGIRRALWQFLEDVEQVDVWFDITGSTRKHQAIALHSSSTATPLGSRAVSRAGAKGRRCDAGLRDGAWTIGDSVTRATPLTSTTDTAF
jgi:hypothetical protein